MMLYPIAVNVQEISSAGKKGMFRFSKKGNAKNSISEGKTIHKILPESSATFWVLWVSP